MRHLVLAFALTTAACVEPAATTAALDEGATKGAPAPDPRLASTCAPVLAPATAVPPDGVNAAATAFLPAAGLVAVGAGVRAFGSDAQITWRIVVPTSGKLYAWVHSANDNPITLRIDDTAMTAPPAGAGWLGYALEIPTGEHHLDIQLAGAAEFDKIVLATAPLADVTAVSAAVTDPPVYGPRAYRMRALPFAAARFAVAPADRYADDPTAWSPTTMPGGTAAPITVRGTLGQRVSLAIGVATNPAMFAIPASVEVSLDALTAAGAPTLPAGLIDVRALSVQDTRVAAFQEIATKTRPTGQLLVKDEAFCARDVITAGPSVPAGVQGPFGGGRARGVLAPGDQRQFWVTVQLPSGGFTASTRYTGALRVVVDGFTGDAITVPVEVVVDPIALEPAPGVNGAYYFGCRDGSACDDDYQLEVDTPRMQRHLWDMHVHGLDSIWALEGLRLPTTSPRLVELAASAGLDRLALLAAANAGDQGLLPWYDAAAPGRVGIGGWAAAIADEPHDETQVATAIANSEAHRHACDGQPASPRCPPGFVHQSMVTVHPGWLTRLLPHVDLPLLVITGHGYPAAVDQVHAAGKPAYYYFALPGVDPLVTRVFAGTYPRALGYQGMFVYAYAGPQAIHGFTMVVDDDHDLPVPTRQGQAVREGLDDVRLWATLRHALKARDVDCATPPSDPTLATACAVVRARVECAPYNTACDRAAGARIDITQYAIGRTTAELDADRDALLAALVAVSAP